MLGLSDYVDQSTQNRSQDALSSLVQIPDTRPGVGRSRLGERRSSGIRAAMDANHGTAGCALAARFERIAARSSRVKSSENHIQKKLFTKKNNTEFHINDV